MSWCDKLASTPTVGFKLSTHFAPIEIILNAFSPILDRATESEAKNITLDQPNTFFSASFNTSDGFKYAMDESNVSVAFTHRVKFRNVSGGPPIMEMLSKPLPFTTLLPTVSSKLIEATLLMPQATKRTVNRVSVTSTTPLAEEDLPPGVKRLIEYVGRPWNDNLDSFNIQISARLSDSGDVSDRCIHRLMKPEDKDQLLTIQFGWQRSFTTGWQITKPNLERVLEQAKKDSLKYFEDLAEGSRFDEVLIRAATSV